MEQTPSNPLPKKEAAMLRGLFKLYEEEKYTKGLRDTSDILKKFPDHPETNSLRGLFLYQNKRKEEGLRLAKEGLMKNLSSGVCWHILGMLNRNEKKYSEAIGCFKNALKYKPDNINILRDIAILQVHARELSQHLETRKAILTEKSNIAINWIGVSLAECLLGNYEEALKVLTSFRNVLTDENLSRMEKSELILFEATLMLNLNKYQDLIDYLEKNEKIVLDKTALNEYIVKAYFRLGQPGKSDPHIKFLLDKYPENLKIIDLLIESKGLKECNNDTRPLISDLHKQLIEDYPQSLTIRRSQLKYLEDDQFRENFNNYIQLFFVTGQSSLFSNVRELLNDSKNAQIIEEVILQNCQSLEENKTFYNSKEPQNPSIVIWGYLFLGLYFSWKGDYSKALENIDKAIQQAPNVIELHTSKAKIFQTCLNYRRAAESADKARNMDPTDRYLNNLTVKYRFRNNDIIVGDYLLKEYNKNTSDAFAHELQYMWFECELGNAYLQQKKFGPAFRQFKFLEKHFQDLYDEQFDMYGHCLTTYQLRAYVNLIKHTDNIYNNKWYIKGALSMIKGLCEYEDIISKLPKKNEEVKKPEEKKILTELEKLDLKGEKLLNDLKSPLDEACKFASRLLPCTIESEKYRIAVFTQICSLYLRRGDHVLALKAFNKIADLAHCNVDVHFERIKLIREIQRYLTNSDLNIEKKVVLEEELNKLLKGSDLTQLDESFKSSYPRSLINEIKITEIDSILGLIEKQDILARVNDSVEMYKNRCSLKEAVAVVKKLEGMLDENKEILQKIKDEFKERFCLCPIFNGEAIGL